MLSAAIKSVIMRGIHATGWELQSNKPLRVIGPYPQDRIRPLATYAPWNADQQFQEAYRMVKDHTLVDIYRCYELWSLAGNFNKLPPGDGLEVGVWRGGTGALVAKKCALMGLDQTLFLCDTFRGVVKSGPLDTSYRDGAHSDTNAQIVTDLLNKVAGEQKLQFEILEGIFPDETASRIESRKFRYCHIDVDVYESARDILHWVWNRMVPGGVVVFDDYGFASCDGVTRLVEEEAQRADSLLLHNLNGHAILVRLYQGCEGA